MREGSIKWELNSFRWHSRSCGPWRPHITKCSRLKEHQRLFRLFRIITFKFKTVRDLFISTSSRKPKALLHFYFSHDVGRRREEDKVQTRSEAEKSVMEIGRWDMARVQHIFFIATRHRRNKWKIVWRESLRFLARAAVERPKGPSRHRRSKLN